MIKIPTAQIKEGIYHSLNSRFFPEECCKGAEEQGMNYTLINTFLRRTNRTKNVAMAGIDNKNVHDIVPQSWIIYCVKIYKISDEVIKFIDKTMKSWRV